MACHLPALAPRLPGHPAPEAGTQERHGTKEHTEEEWEAIRDTVQVLYIRDGRKLCETMAIIERRHGFWAT